MRTALHLPPRFFTLGPSTCLSPYFVLFVSGWRFGGDVRGGMGKNDLIPLAVVNAGES